MPNKRRFTDAQEQEFAKAYLSGESTLSIAKRFNVTHPQIANGLRRCGVQLRSCTSHVRKYQVNESVFSSINPASAYWIGFLMADGCVTDPRGSNSPLVTLTLSSKDRGHVESFRDFLQSNHPIVERPPSSKSLNTSFRICIASRQLVADLSSYGVVPRKSLVATAPDSLVDNRDFWRGVIDGDGSVGTSLGRGGRPCSYISLVGSHNLVLQFSQFVKSLCHAPRSRIFQKGNIWRFMLGARNARVIIKRLYETAEIALPRKALKAADAMIPPVPRSTCIHGHPLTPENRRSANRGRTTYCITCRRLARA